MKQSYESSEWIKRMNRINQKLDPADRSPDEVQYIVGKGRRSGQSNKVENQIN